LTKSAPFTSSCMTRWTSRTTCRTSPISCVSSPTRRGWLGVFCGSRGISRGWSIVTRGWSRRVPPNIDRHSRTMVR